VFKSCITTFFLFSQNQLNAPTAPSIKILHDEIKELRAEMGQLSQKLQLVLNHTTAIIGEF
jgi:hypothetical protein